MAAQIFVQRVGVAVQLDRRLNPGDELVVEARQNVRHGELLLSQEASGVYIGLYDSTATDIWIYPVDAPGGPIKIRKGNLNIKGVVIAQRSCA